MADERSPAQKAYGDISHALADLSDRVVFGEVWERPGLSKRDRSLITVATLVALSRTNKLPGSEVITQFSLSPSFYAARTQKRPFRSRGAFPKY